MSSNVSDQNPVEQVAEVVQVAPTDQELSLVAVENEHAVTTSLRVAEVFGKQHKDVLRAVKSLDCSEDFHKRNFALMQKSIKIGNGAERKSPMYYITRDGFMFLVMGFTGKTAAKWKEAYIKAFNEMEAKIRAEQMAKAIEEHDRKEAEEYEKLLEREEREEAAIDARVAAMPPAKSRKRQAEPQTTEQPATTSEGRHRGGNERQACNQFTHVGKTDRAQTWRRDGQRAAYVQVFEPPKPYVYQVGRLGEED